MNTVMAVCFTQSLQVFLGRAAQVERAEVVFAEVKVRHAEVIEVHRGGVAQRASDDDG